jgi:hypothetical protein
MNSTNRDRLRREIFDSLPVERIISAAVLMMRWQHAELAPDAAIHPSKVVEFIASLDVDGLSELRRVAQKVEGGTVH